MSNKRSPIGRIIHTVWNNLNVRCINGVYKDKDASALTRNRLYNDVRIDMTRVAFKNYCISNSDYILGLSRPSIDRKDNSKHYAIDNIQFIELVDNIRKDKIKAKNGVCICYSCKEEKPIVEFIKDSRRINGYSTICKVCERLRCKNKYKHERLNAG